MSKTLLLAAAAAFAFTTAAIAAPPSDTPPAGEAAKPATPTTSANPDPAASPATPASPAVTGGASDTAASANAPVTPLSVGMKVKDNTGAEIGSISELKPGSDGQQMATIQMGSDRFAVAVGSLAAANGAATVNLSKAELMQKLHPGH